MDQQRINPDSRDGLVTPGEFRVLALDGGGIRGALIAGFLARVESALGGGIAQQVDLIVGTSTGSIVGALLALGFSSKYIESFYVEQGRFVFEPPQKQRSKWLGAALVFGVLAVIARLVRDVSLTVWTNVGPRLPHWLTDALNWLTGQNGEHMDQIKGYFGVWLIGLLAGASLLFLLVQLLVWFRQKGFPLYWLLFAKYGLRDLEAQFEKCLQDNYAGLVLRPGASPATAQEIKVDDASRRLLITAYDIARNEALVIKTKHQGTSATDSWGLIDAVRCSSAAPFFFPPKRIDAGEMGRVRAEDFGMNCDGGVWANNPALVGYVEAKKILREIGQSDARIKVLSIGTGLSGGGAFKKPLIGYGVLWWLGPFIGALWNGQAANVAYMLSKLVEFPDYIRVNFSIGPELASMDNVQNVAGLLRAAAGNAQIEDHPGADPVRHAVDWLQRP